MNCLFRKINFLLPTWLFSATLLIASSCDADDCNSFLCEKSDICVIGGLQIEQDAVCVEAQNTRDFFLPLNLDFPVQLKVALKQQIQPSEDALSLGRYNPKSNSVILLDYQSAVAASHLAPPAFGVPMSFPLWRSYLAHEIAHAIIEKNAVASDDTLAPTEYIAAVAQLSTLPEDILQYVLSNYRNIPAFKDVSEITDLYYFMKPCEFAVKAYRHYSLPENGLAFIRQLLDKGLPGSGVRGNIPFF